MDSEKLYYVQNPSCVGGEPMLWWKKGDYGYASDIQEAKVFTESEIGGMFSIKLGEKIAYPKDFIDGLTQHHIDTQDCAKSEAYKP